MPRLGGPTEQKRAHDRARAQRMRAFVASEKLRRGVCLDCGMVVTEENTFVFDFDHRDPTQKEFKIAGRMNTNVDAILAEIEKCDLVCANCHRVRTMIQRRAGIITDKPKNEARPTSPSLF